MRVAIVGAGPAGCAAAIELCRQRHEVVLISDAAHGVGEQLSPAARPLLERLGLLPLPQQLHCVGTRAAWASAELSHQDFLFHPFGHGWLLDRTTFGTHLRQCAVAAGATLHEPARLLDVHRRGDWRVRLSNREVHADFLIDATGRSGAVVRRLGIKRMRFDRQVATLGCFVANHDDADATLTVESTDQGWWYTCRVPHARRVVASITVTRACTQDWQATLRDTRHISELVRNCRLAGPLVVRCASSARLERSCGPGWLAIGDAAASYDPLSSRGLTEALRSGIEAATLIGASPTRCAERDAAAAEQFALYLAERHRHYEEVWGRESLRG